jgi:hypothetical protein
MLYITEPPTVMLQNEILIVKCIYSLISDVTHLKDIKVYTVNV